MHLRDTPRPLKFPPIFPYHKGCIGYYPFTSRSGNKLYDRSGKANHGTITGATWDVESLVFDGTNDSVSLGSNIAPTTGLTLASLCAFQTPTEQYKNDSLIAKMVSVSPYLVWKIGFETTNNNLRFDVRRNGSNVQVVSTDVLTAGTVYHIAGTFDGTIIRIYRDGVLKGTTTLSGNYPIDDLTSPSYLGFEQANARYFKGQYWTAHIYNRALNAAEIKRLYESEIMLVRS